MSNLNDINGKNYNCVFLDWDTSYFGVSSAKVNLVGPVGEKNQNKILKLCKGYDFVTISNLNNLKENNHWIGTRTNAFLVDINIQYLKLLDTIPSYINKEIYVMNELPRNGQIVDIAKNSFKHSRFFNDPKLPEDQAKNIYIHWTECAFDMEDKYFVISESDCVVKGYIIFTINEDNSVIELIAVDERYRGLNVGKSMIQVMESFVLANGVKTIKVGTQVNNIPAIQFYSSLGFKYNSCRSIYHLWGRY